MEPIPPVDRPPPPAPPPPPPPGVAVPLLVSAIFNFLAAIGWATTCVLSPIGVPLLVLAIFELITFTKLRTFVPRAMLKGRVKTLAVLEICTILAGNVPSMICGIIVLVYADELDRG